MEVERDGHSEPSRQHSTEPMAPRVAYVGGTQEEAAGYVGPSPRGNTTINSNYGVVDNFHHLCISTESTKRCRKVEARVLFLKC